MKIKKLNEMHEENWDFEFEDEEQDMDIENSKFIKKLTDVPYKGTAKWLKGKTFYGIVFDMDRFDKENRYIGDGVYDVTGIDFVEAEEGFRFTNKNKRDELAKFILNNEDNLYYASAYETGGAFFLNAKPTRIPNVNIKGSGFNYGSTNVITNCPQQILILAEND